MPTGSQAWGEVQQAGTLHLPCYSLNAVGHKIKQRHECEGRRGWPAVGEKQLECIFICV